MMNPKSLKPTRKTFIISEAFPEGIWYTEIDRLRRIAHSQLAKLEELVTKINSMWPKPLSESLKGSEIPADLNALVEERDLTSEITQLYALMAVEAFLNYYGAVRIGEEDYKTHFERLSLVPKVQQLLLICDSKSIMVNDPIIKAIELLAESRNKLIHPKASKAKSSNDPQKLGTHIPKAAQGSVTAMITFFNEFELLTPDSKHFFN